MGFWKDRADEFTGRDKPPAKTVNRSTNRGSQARGTVYGDDGKLQVVPIEDVLTEDGRWRGPKGRR